MTYVHGFVAAVPKANRQAFIDHAKIAADIFKKAGALSVMENWQVDVPDGEVTSFPMAVQKADDEDVVFSWIVWPSKDIADAAMAAMMDDPAMSMENNPMPFDGKRMIYGGFETIFSA